VARLRLTKGEIREGVCVLLPQYHNSYSILPGGFEIPMYKVISNRTDSASILARLYGFIGLAVFMRRADIATRARHHHRSDRLAGVTVGRIRGRTARTIEFGVSAWPANFVHLLDLTK
jgi:hypothetical protein